MTARALAKLVGTFHNVSYYAPEMKAFSGLGLAEYWRAYMAYRSAPMGTVPASVVEATFYNFAPAFVQAAIPSAWTTTSPAEVMELRDRCITDALHRGLMPVDTSDQPVDHESLGDAADLALPAMLTVPAGARPLFAAHQTLPVPDDPVLRLWHACTLWREYRGDGHNIALASAGIDGIECHVLLGAKGVGNQKTIEKIRGWSSADWAQAQDRLVARGLLEADGTFTETGAALRKTIEDQTDQLCEPALRALSTEAYDQFVATMEPLVGRLKANGIVPGRWPPPQSPA